MCSTLGSVDRNSGQRKLIGFISDEVDASTRYNVHVVGEPTQDVQLQSLEEILAASSASGATMARTRTQPARSSLSGRSACLQRVAAARQLAEAAVGESRHSVCPQPGRSRRVARPSVSLVARVHAPGTSKVALERHSPPTRPGLCRAVAGYNHIGPRPGLGWESGQI